MTSLKEQQKKINKTLFRDNTVKSGHEAQKMLSPHVQEIKKQRETEGESIQELASKYNVLNVSMAYFLHKNNIYTEIHRNIPETMFKKVINNYNNCNSIKQISKNLKIPEHRVDKILYLYFHHNPNKPTKNHKKPTDLDKRKSKVKSNLSYYYKNLYIRKRFSIRDLAKVTNTNRSFIRSLFVQHKLPRRTNIAPNNQQLKRMHQSSKISPSSLLKQASDKIKKHKNIVLMLQKRCSTLEKTNKKQQETIDSLKSMLKKLLNQL